MKKIRKIIIIIVLIFFVIWTVMFFTDYSRCKSLKDPVFAVQAFGNPDGEGLWKGLGYDIDLYKETNSKTGERYTSKIRLGLFGRGVIRVTYINGEIDVLKYSYFGY